MEGVYNHSLMPAHHLNTTSSSCPAVLDNLQNEAPKKKGGRQRERTPPGFRTDEEMKNWQKERVKKDNHNQSKLQPPPQCRHV